MSEDAVQEAFIRIAKNFNKVGDIFCPQTRNFTVIITKNVALTMYNDNKIFYDAENYDEEIHYTLSASIFENFNKSDLGDCIARLPERYRYPLYLYHFYGYNLREISSLLSISVETSKKRVQRARHLIKQMIERDDNFEE